MAIVKARGVTRPASTDAGGRTAIDILVHPVRPTGPG